MNTQQLNRQLKERAYGMLWQMRKIAKRHKLRRFTPPHDYKDRTTPVGPKTFFRGSRFEVDPCYTVMADGSIRWTNSEQIYA